MVQLADERNVETLRQISLLLDRENQRLIATNIELRAELARLRGLPDVEQFTFTVERQLQETRARIFQRDAADTHQDATRPTRPPQVGHGPREQPTLPIVEIRHELTGDERQCPACGGALIEMAGQYETSARITT